MIIINEKDWYQSTFSFTVETKLKKDVEDAKANFELEKKEKTSLEKKLVKMSIGQRIPGKFSSVFSYSCIPSFEIIICSSITTSFRIHFSYFRWRSLERFHPDYRPRNWCLKPCGFAGTGRRYQPKGNFNTVLSISNFAGFTTNSKTQ